MVGMTCGQTRSGKDIKNCVLDSKTDELLPVLNRNFTVEDCFDAYALYGYLAIRENYGSPGNENEWKNHFVSHYNFYRNRLDESNVLGKQKLLAGVNNAFELRFGRSLAHIIFK